MNSITAANGTIETYRPGSFVTWRAEDLPSAEDYSADRAIALIGEAEGGEQGRVYTITSLAAAEAIFRAGALLSAIKLAFAAGGTRTPLVFAVNVLGGTPATFEMPGTGGEPFARLTTTRAFRERANQTTLLLTGNAASGYNIAIRDPETGTDVSSNRLGVGLHLQYQGRGTAAIAEVVVEGGSKYLVVTTEGASDGLKIPLTGGVTTRQLAQQISRSGPFNALTGRDATLFAGDLDVTTTPVDIMQFDTLGTNTALAAASSAEVVLTLAAPATIPTGTQLRYYTVGGWQFTKVTSDGSASTTLKVASLPAALPADAKLFAATSRTAPALSAVQADFALFFETRAAGMIAFESAGNGNAPAEVSGHFAGGLTTPAQYASWNAAVDNLSGVPLSVVVPLTDDQAVASGVRASVSLRNSAENAKFCSTISGFDSTRLPGGNTAGEVDSYIAELAAELGAINSYQDQVVTQAMDATDAATGRRVRIPPYMVAAAMAAMRASFGPGESLTYKTLPGSNPFPRLNLAQSNAVVRSGGVCLEESNRGSAARIVRDRTTYVGSDNPVYESGKQVAIMNSIARSMRALQDQFIPGNASLTRLADFQNSANQMLDSRLQAGWLIEGFGPDGDRIEPYTFQLLPTRSGGQHVRSRVFLNPSGEFTVGDSELIGRAVELVI